MPIYDFQCSVCGYQDEVMRKASDASTSDCPECNKQTFSKMLSAPSFQLSGTGWYATDFKNSGKPERSDAQKSAPKKEKEVADKAVSSCEPGCGCH